MMLSTPLLQGIPNSFFTKIALSRFHTHGGTDRSLQDLPEDIEVFHAESVKTTRILQGDASTKGLADVVGLTLLFPGNL